MLWEHITWCRTPQLGNLTWGSELSLLWKNLCNIIILQFVGHPPGGMWLDYIVSSLLQPSLLWFLLYVFSYGRSFLVGSSLFLLMVVLQIAMILVCSWEEVSSVSFYSTVLGDLPFVNHLYDTLLKVELLSQSIYMFIYTTFMYMYFICVYLFIFYIHIKS